MRIHVSLATALALGIALTFSLAQAQQREDGPAEGLGRRIDRQLGEIAEELRQTWAEARKTVDQLGVRGRVYGRLRWDKAFAEQPIGVAIEARDTVVLSGQVPDEAAREKAVRLAEDTVGVREVVDRLEIEPHDSTDAATPPEPEP